MWIESSKQVREKQGIEREWQQMSENKKKRKKYRMLVGVSKDWAEAKSKEGRESKKLPVTMPVRDEAYNVAAPCTANSHR